MKSYVTVTEGKMDDLLTNFGHQLDTLKYVPLTGSFCEDTFGCEGIPGTTKGNIICTVSL